MPRARVLGATRKGSSVSRLSGQPSLSFAGSGVARSIDFIVARAGEMDTPGSENIMSGLLLPSCVVGWRLDSNLAFVCVHDEQMQEFGSIARGCSQIQNRVLIWRARNENKSKITVVHSPLGACHLARPLTHSTSLPMDITTEEGS
jgi:hypothetical protein